jgi:hypothetical protein
VAVAFESVKKTEGVFNQKKGRRWQRKSPTSKNEHYRRMLSACVKNRIGFFRYVLNDIWYASSENMRHVKEELKKEFVMPIKTNRKVALSPVDNKRGAYEQVGSLELEPNTTRRVFTRSKCPSRCSVVQARLRERGR